MHIAYTGPKILKIDDEGYPVQPYGFKTNSYSILDVADIVFINPVNTGYSRMVKVDGKLPNRDTFFGINADQREIKNAMNFSNIGHLFERLILKEEIIGNSSEFSGLSGGEIKRVFLSIAYLSDKFVIMLDEPLTGIDKASRDIIAKSIKELSLERPVFFVTHETPTDLNIEVDLDIFIQREMK